MPRKRNDYDNELLENTHGTLLYHAYMKILVIIIIIITIKPQIIVKERIIEESGNFIFHATRAEDKWFLNPFY